jgi:3-hydroxybutyryl-CoA dehydratase
MKSVREGDPLPKVEKTVTQDRIDRYAEASGDFNPIHVDQDFAAGSHFGGTVAHGMMVAASISEMMTAAFGTDWLRSGRLKLRFRAPVLPGDTVTAFGAVKRVRQLDGATEVACSVGVRRQNDESAITGDATVTLASAGSTS